MVRTVTLAAKGRRRKKRRAVHHKRNSKTKLCQVRRWSAAPSLQHVFRAHRLSVLVAACFGPVSPVGRKSDRRALRASGAAIVGVFAIVALFGEDAAEVAFGSDDEGGPPSPSALFGAGGGGATAARAPGGGSSSSSDDGGSNMFG